jgi:hypothetical protein
MKERQGVPHTAHKASTRLTWHVTSCRLVEASWDFGRFVANEFFNYHHDEGSRILWKFGNLTPNYMTSHITRHKPPWLSAASMSVFTRIHSIKTIYSSMVNFTFMWPCIAINFLIIKPTRWINISNLFWNETLYVSDSSSVHHQELFTYTQQWYMSYRFANSFRAAGSGWNCSSILILFESCLQTCMTYNIVECAVNNSWWWTKELSETCRVSFQNKFEELVHLVGFIIR